MKIYKEDYYDYTINLTEKCCFEDIIDIDFETQDDFIKYLSKNLVYVLLLERFVIKFKK